MRLIWRRLVCGLIFAAGLLASVPAVSQSAVSEPISKSVTDAQETLLRAEKPEPNELVVFNRKILTLHATYLGMQPEMRARRSEALIAETLALGGPGKVAVEASPFGEVITIDGRFAVTVQPRDVDQVNSDSAAETARQAALRLTDAIAANQNLLSNLHNSRRSAAQQLLEQLEALNTSETYETDFKTVCHILLQTYLSENGVSENQIEILTEIAHKCRYEGGIAVLQARASLSGEWDWSAYDDCPDATERTSNGTENFAVGLYPNPAKDAALLDLGNTVTTGRAILRDLSGRALQEWVLDGQRQIWLRWSAERSSGLYLLEIITDQSEPQVLKMSIKRN
jgi:hypothetical protein